jgi:hypothetical protein
MKKISAVEWLIKEWPILEAQLPAWLIEQAKEMEKEQIVNSYKEGHYHLHLDSFNPEQYYNETFKSEE